jgi:prepilin-type N-terminal cleavage/methylation domain-containing protein
MFRNNREAPPLPDPQDNTNDSVGGDMSYELRVAGCEQRQSSRFQLATRNSQPATSRPAFTMIELLVVIGIILILMGLFFAGAKLVTAQAKERDTKTMLETCKTMFENYRQATHLSRYPPGLFFGPGCVPPTSWYTAQESVMWPTGSTPSWMGTVSPDVLWPPTNPPTPKTLASPPLPSPVPPFLLDTAYVFYALESLHENQNIIANLPANKKINVLLPNGTPVAWPVDAWGDLILFVPGGGLGVYNGSNTNGLVWLDGATAGIITSAGTITGSSTPYNLSTYPPSAPLANQPFFVSAGPDGDVSNAHGNTSSTPTSDMTDDNIYSFQN